MNILDDLEEAWQEAEEIEEYREGDILITKLGDEIFNVFTTTHGSRVADPSITRRYKRARIVVDDDVLALAAEYRDDPGYGRHVFTRSAHADVIWVDEEGSECRLDELQKIRSLKDEGEYL